MDGESTASLLVLRKERVTILEGSHLLRTPLPNLPNRSCHSLKGATSAALHGVALPATGQVRGLKGRARLLPCGWVAE